MGHATAHSQIGRRGRDKVSDTLFLGRTVCQFHDVLKPLATSGAQLGSVHYFCFQLYASAPRVIGKEKCSRALREARTVQNTARRRRNPPCEG